MTIPVQGRRHASAAAVSHAARMVPSMRAYVGEIQAAWGSYPSAHDPRQRHPETSGSADWHLDVWERWKLLNKSRATERENEWYDATIGNFAALAVGAEGPEPIWLGPGVDANLSDIIQRKWWDDSTHHRFDVSGQYNWAEQLALRVRSIVRDGDVLVWHDGKGAVAHYESDRLGKVFTMPRTGQVLGYQLNADDSPMRAAVPDAGGGAYIAGMDADFIAWRTRFGQTRGAPVLQSSLTRWNRLSSLVESEIISSESASLPWTVLSTGMEAESLSAPTVIDENDDDLLAENPTETISGWLPTDAGHMFAPPKGINAQPWIPNRPNIDIPPFVTMNLRRFVAPLCPYEVLFSDFEGLSYATIRGLGQMARQKINKWRGGLLQSSIDRQATDWLKNKIKTGAIDVPEDFDVDALRLEWRWEELDIRDREKDALTAQREDELGHASMRDRLGPDWTRVQDQRAEEQDRQAEIAHQARMRQVARDKEYAAALSGLPGLAAPAVPAGDATP